MPIRIKPVHDLKPCVLDLESIQGICALIEGNFNRALFSAEDGAWEVFDAGRGEFISAIELRETLDSFTIRANNILVQEFKGEAGAVRIEHVEKEINIIFDRHEATVKFTGPYEMENWFEHFIIDLKKHLRSPRLRQRLRADKDSNVYGSLGVAIAGIAVTELSGGRYCQIILKERPPNAFVENVKANLFSNLIWVVIVFVAGSLFTLLSLWLYGRYGLNINEWLAPP